VHPKGAKTMAISGLSFEDTLVVTWWAVLVLCTNGQGNSSHLVGLPFLAVKLFPRLDEQLPAQSHDYCKLVNVGCGLNHERVEDGCRGTCVKFRDAKFSNNQVWKGSGLCMQTGILGPQKQVVSILSTLTYCWKGWLPQALQGMYVAVPE